MRTHILFRAVMSLFALPICYFYSIPFPLAFLSVAFLTFAGHVLVFIFYERLSNAHLAMLNVLSIIFISVVVLHTGGILSPFIVFYVAVIVSDTIFNPLPSPTLFVSISAYIMVGIIQYGNRYPALRTIPLDISHPLPSLLITAAVVCAIFVRGHLLQRGTIVLFKARLLKHRHETERAREQIGALNARYHKELMLSHVLHELCMPLSCIQGFIRTTKQHYTLEGPLQKNLLEMQEELSRINAVVQQMRNLSKPAVHVRKNIRLAAVISNIMAILKIDCKFAQVSFHSALDMEQVIVAGVPEDIQEILYSLLKNAAESVLAAGKSSAGSVVIEVVSGEAAVLVTVKHNGSLIHAQEIEAMRKDCMNTPLAARRTDLCIVQHILMAYGSSLSIQSVKEKGTAISFCLPRGDALLEGGER